MMKLMQLLQYLQPQEISCTGSRSSFLHRWQLSISFSDGLTTPDLLYTVASYTS